MKNEDKQTFIEIIALFAKSKCLQAELRMHVNAASNTLIGSEGQLPPSQSTK